MKRKLWFMLLVLLLIPGKAAAVQDEGSLHLIMRWNGSSVPGGTVAVYDVSKLDTDTDPQWLAQYATTYLSPLKTVSVDSDGWAACSGLGTGMYLVVQENAAVGFLPINPFLFSVPIRIGDETEYCVEAAPKLAPVVERTLPQTGQIIWPVWLLGGLGTCFLGVGLLIGKKN